MTISQPASHESWLVRCFPRTFSRGAVKPKTQVLAVSNLPQFPSLFFFFFFFLLLLLLLVVVVVVVVVVVLLLLLLLLLNIDFFQVGNIFNISLI